MTSIQALMARLLRSAGPPVEGVRQAALSPEFRDDPMFAPLATMTEAEAEATLQAMERASEAELRAVGLRR